MGKITLLVRTCLIIFLFFCSNTYLLAYGNADLENFTSTSESICYMFFESKEIESVDFNNSLLETFIESPYKAQEKSTSAIFAKPTVNLGANPTITVCQGVTSANLAYTDATNSANKFTINYDPASEGQGFKDVPKTTFAGGSSGNFPLVFPSNPAPGTYNATLRVHNNSTTEGDSENYPIKIIINTIPTVEAPTNQAVCNNSNTTSVNFSGNTVNGKSYTWTNDKTSIGLSASGTGNIAAFKAINTTNLPVTATIKVTPTANGCVGTPQTFEITVNPTASFTKPADIVACNNEAISAINFSGASVTGTTYTWTNDNSSIGLATSGNGNILAFTAKNTTNAPIIGNITVTPTANGCVGTPQTFKVTVNPTATFTKPADIVACNNEAISAINFSGASVSGTTYTWTNDNVNIGLATSGNGNISAFTAINNTNTPLIGNITVTPIANGCVGTPQTFKATVNPTVTFIKPADIVACNDESISTINFSGASVDGTTYTWINDNASIGLATSGTGDISAFTSKNTTNTPIIGNITVTPSANNCLGTPQTFEITVNPTPVVTKPLNLTFCNSEISPEIVFQGSSVANTTYNWTNNNPNIGLAASGTGNIPSFTTNNTGTSQITSEITVTPIANNCAGESQTFTIKVNPSIKIDIEFTPVSCNGEKNGIIEITSATGGNGTLRFSLDNTNFDTDPTLDNLYAGVYTVYVKDSEVCTYEIEVEITEPEELSVTESSATDETCFGGINNVHDGTITAGIISGGNGDYEYSIDNSSFQSSPNFIGLAAGNYTIFIKDKKGCATQSNITVGGLSEMKATLSKTDIKCFGENTGIININNPTGGSGDYEYQIVNNNNVTVPEAWISSPEFTDLPSGNYQINIRDVNYPSCVITINESYNLSQPTAALSATTTAVRTLNFGSPTGSATATASGGSGGYTYEWRVLDQINVLQTTKTANSLSAGEYEVTVYDSNGCVTKETISVIDVVKVEISETSRCLENTDKIRTSSFQVDPDLTVGGIGNPYDFVYEWNFGTNANPPTAEGLDRFEVNYTSKGDKVITLTVKDTAGIVSIQKFDHYVGGCFEGCRGINSSQDFQIDKDNYFIGDINGIPLSNDNCSDVSEKYLWIDIIKSVNVYVLDVELIYSTTKDALNLLGVTVPVTDSGQLTGCFGTKNPNSNKDEWKIIPVGLYPLFRVDSAESNFDIEWECEESFSIDQIRIRWTTNSQKECGDATGNSCIDSKDLVPVSVPIFADTDFTDTPCNGTALGSIIIKANGGVKPFAYSLNGDVIAEYVTTKEFYNLAAGNYDDIWVKDSKGTTYHLPSVIISEPDVLALTVAKDTSIICYGGFTSATASVTGGTQPYTYLWNDNFSQDEAQAKELPAGSYTVTVTDANDCQAIATVLIEEPEELTVPIAGEDQSFNCGVISTYLNGNVPEVGEGKWIIKSGSGGELSNELDPLSSFTGDANSTYLLDWTISNPDGTCLKSDEITISFSDDCSALNFDGIDDHVTFGNNYNFPTNNFTLEVWVKLDAIDGIRTVLSKRDASNLGSGGYDLVINNGAPTFRWGNISVSTSTKLTTSRWYHLAVSYNGDKYVLYVDGLDVGTKTGVNPLSIESPFIIGAMYNKPTPEVPSNYFKGWIEELRIWNKALSEDQLHFMMNQRLEIGVSPVKGTILPLEVPGTLSWSDLQGYYQLIATDVANGITLDEATSKINGVLKNIDTNQENSAPLPYTSKSNGVWSDINTWSRPDVWNYPNAVGINGEKIDWNIAEISHDISSGGQDISLLGLFSLSNELKIYNPNENQDETNSGQGLFISHYLKLDGKIKLYGDSQLIQTEGSILDNNSSGFIEKDQQGTASSYNYNYWSSPVVPQGNAINSTYSVAGVMMDGTDSKTPIILNFGQGVTFADGAKSTPGNSQKISNYWIYKFRGKADEYSDFEHIGSTGVLNVGEGYTMKGTSGNAAIADRQNYIFKGKPNNGDISLSVGKDQNYLLGNPYPSAIDANKFILDNLNASGGTNTKNIFNGALYFWDHFGGKTHTLREYVGGYATYNLVGGVKAIATDDRINNNNESSSDEHEPGQYIPVGQGFFINTVLDEELSGSITVDGGDVIFKNSQRAFIREQNYVSRFLSQEKNTASQKEAKSEAKIRLDFSSPMGYNRQILVGLSEYATNGFDLGYDAPLNDYNLEDFFWLIDNREFVIQGVSNFDEDQVLPVGIYISKKGDFSIKINALENVSEITNIYLRDIEENKYFDLRESEFKMEIEPGAYYERFEIVFSKPEETTPDSEEEEESSTEETNTEGSEETTEETEEEIEEIIIPENISISDIDIFYMSNNKELAISNPYLLPIQRVEIYNLLGQKIQQYMEVSTQKEIRLPVVEFATGIYIVKLYNGDSQISKNIILK